MVARAANCKEGTLHLFTCAFLRGGTRFKGYRYGAGVLHVNTQVSKCIVAKPLTSKTWIPASASDLLVSCGPKELHVVLEAEERLVWKMVSPAFKCSLSDVLTAMLHWGGLDDGWHTNTQNLLPRSSKGSILYFLLQWIEQGFSANRVYTEQRFDPRSIFLHQFTEILNASKAGELGHSWEFLDLT